MEAIDRVCIGIALITALLATISCCIVSNENSELEKRLLVLETVVHIYADS